MIKILELKNYTIPYCGNKIIQPYGDLVVTDGAHKKTAKIMDDGIKQYITLKAEGCNKVELFQEGTKVRANGNFSYPLLLKSLKHRKKQRRLSKALHGQQAIMEQMYPII